MPAVTTPIFSVGNAGKKQAAQRDDGQWFYRTKGFGSGRGFHWGRWLPCDSRPDGAWYNPNAGRARLPQEPARKGSTKEGT